MPEPLYLGIDVGTSGLRGSCIDAAGEELAYHRLALPAPQKGNARIQQDPALWKQAMFELILTLSKRVGIGRIIAVAIDGTSSTVLLCDDQGQPLAPALMYNDQSSKLEAAHLATRIPIDSAAQGASSSLAKVLQLLKTHADAAHICHQADWLGGCLSDRFDLSDENNCLKLGYDPVQRDWPEWLLAQGIESRQLPAVHAPGSAIAQLDRRRAFALGLDLECRLVSGTTDSIAAFIATGASESGDAVTSLGSTLVLKIISDKPVFAADYGIYSHRLGDQWLAGGASNSGCRVLAELFSQNQLDDMTVELNPEQPTGLDFYPLPSVGERFPVNDPEMEPRMQPRPHDDVTFFQGLLEGITAIEVAGYNKLAELGAPRPKRIYTTGGGSRNIPWALMREKALGVKIRRAKHTEASYGAALLALKGASNAVNN